MHCVVQSACVCVHHLYTYTVVPLSPFMFACRTVHCLIIHCNVIHVQYVRRSLIACLSITCMHSIDLHAAHIKLDWIAIINAIYRDLASLIFIIILLN